MAITLDVSADMELLLNKQATRNGQDVTAYLLSLVEKDLGDLSEYTDLEDFASSVAAVQQGFEDIDAGRTYSLEEVEEFLETNKRERWAAQAGKGSP